VPFLAIDGFLFRHAWQRTRSAHRYGTLGLELSQLPLALGSSFEVLLEIPASLEGEATLKLYSDVTVTTGRGDNKKSYTKTVFETSTQVPIEVSGQRSIIRASLQLPEDQKGSSWWLAFTAPELSELFELPVFKVDDPAVVERFTLAKN
jgi:hypothetical protein